MDRLKRNLKFYIWAGICLLASAFGVGLAGAPNSLPTSSIVDEAETHASSIDLSIEDQYIDASSDYVLSSDYNGQTVSFKNCYFTGTWGSGTISGATLYFTNCIIDSNLTATLTNSNVYMTNVFFGSNVTSFSTSSSSGTIYLNHVNSVNAISYGGLTIAEGAITSTSSTYEEAVKDIRFFTTTDYDGTNTWTGAWDFELSSTTDMTGWAYMVTKDVDGDHVLEGSNATITTPVPYAYADKQWNDSNAGYRLILYRNLPGDDTASTSVRTFVAASVGTISSSTIYFSRTGYTHNWSYSANGEGSQNVTINQDGALYAIWSVGKYAVKLHDNDGTGKVTTVYVKYHTGVYSTSACADADKITSVTIPTRTGYRFNGYKNTEYATTIDEATNSSGVFTSEILNVTSGDYYAEWTPIVYTVNLDDGGVGIGNEASDTDTIYLKYGTSWHASATDSDGDSWLEAQGDAIASITAPTRAGYVFKGYYTEKGTIESSKQIINASGVVNSDRLAYLASDTTALTNKADTLYAVWEAASYDAITLDSGFYTSATDTVGDVATNESTDTDTVSIVYGVSMNPDPIENPTQTGYTFAGYYTQKYSGGSQIIDANGNYIKTSAALDGISILYAHWTANGYSINLDSDRYESATDTTGDVATNESVDTDSVTITYATGMTPETVVTPIQTGYTFMGYYTEKYSGGKLIISADGQCVDTTTITSNDVTLYAQWSALSNIKVTFDPNGGTVSPTSKTVTFGQAYGDLPTPIYAGYNFVKWVLQTDTSKTITASTIVNIATDHTLVAQWIPATFTIELDDGGDIDNEEDVTDIIYLLYNTNFYSEPACDNEIDSVVVPSKTGYHFKGYWTMDGSENGNWGTNIIDESGNIVGSKTFTTTNTVLVAKWEGITVTVTFDPNGGTVSPTSKTVTFGQAYGDLPTPTKTGHEFVGWHLIEMAGEVVSSETIVSTASDHCLVAEWKVDSFTAILDSELYESATDEDGLAATNEHEDTDSVDIVYNTEMNPETIVAPTQTGYTFLGYYTEKYSGGTCVISANGTCASTTTVVADGTTLYAHWNANVYRIDLDHTGGTSTGTSPIYLKYNTGWYSDSSTTIAIFTVAIPTKTGYTFAGYNTEANGLGTQIVGADGTIVGSTTYTTANDTLYANWTPNVYEVTYDLNYVGAPAATTGNQTYDSYYTNLPNPVRAGYQFAGWFTNRAEGTQVTTAVKVTIAGDHTLYAHWTAKNYTINYELNDGSGSYNSQTYNIESTESLLTLKERAHYEFVGWKATAINVSEGNWTKDAEYPTNLLDSTNKTLVGMYGNVTLQAIWTAKTHTITINYVSSIVSTETTLAISGTGFDVESSPLSTESAAIASHVYDGNSHNLTIAKTTEGKNYLIVVTDEHGVEKSGVNSVEYIWNSNDGDTTIAVAVTELYTMSAAFGDVEGGTDDATYSVPNESEDTIEGYVKHGTSVTFSATVMVGYSWLGWAKSTNGEVVYAAQTYTTTATESLTLYTRTTYGVFEITLEENESSVGDKSEITNEGSDTDKIYLQYGQDWWLSYLENTLSGKTTTIVKPEKNGYTFLGYYDDDVQIINANGEIVGEKTFVSGDTTIYAKWEGKTYDIHFDLNLYSLATLSYKGVEYKLGETIVGCEETYEWVKDNSTQEYVAIKVNGTNYYLGASFGELTDFEWLIAGGTGATVGFGTTDADLKYDTAWYVNGTTTPFNNTNGDTVLGDDFNIPSIMINGQKAYTFGGYWVKTNGSLDGYAIINNAAVFNTNIFIKDFASLSFDTDNNQNTTEIVLYAMWTPINFEVTANLNGGAAFDKDNGWTIAADGLTAKKSVQYGAAFGTLPTAVRAGYNFLGWANTDNATAVNVTVSTVFNSASVGLGETQQAIYAVWEEIEYTITYDLAGGAYDGSATIANKNYTITSKDVLPAPTKVGYRFAGWQAQTDAGNWETGTNYAAGKSLSGMYGNVTLVAQWQNENYTITLDQNGATTTGTTSVDVVYESTTSITVTAPARNGFTFAGWTTEKNGGVKVINADGSFVASVTGYTNASAQWQKAANTTLYASWDGISYNISYVLNGGSDESAGKTSYTSNAGTTQEINLWNPTKTGYSFAGWTVAKEGVSVTKPENANETPVLAISAGTYGNITLTATFSAISGIKVNFAGNGGTVGTESINVVYDDVYGSLPTADRNGYSFAGWYTNAIGGTEVKADTKVSTAVEHTLYAHWTADGYTITYNANNGAAVASLNYNIESTDTLASTTRNGYKFVEWIVESVEGDANWTVGSSWAAGDSVVGQYGNVTLKAVWEAVTYTITYDNGLSDGNKATATKEYTIETATFTLDANVFERTGYVLENWTVAADGTKNINYGGPFAEAVGTTIIAASTVETGTWGNYTVVAQWTAKKTEIGLSNIVFHLGVDGNGPTRHTATFGEVVTQITSSGVPAGFNTVAWKYGYTFEGYYTAANGGVKVFNADGTVVTDKDVTESGTTWLLKGGIWNYSDATSYTGISINGTIYDLSVSTTLPTNYAWVVDAKNNITGISINETEYLYGDVLPEKHNWINTEVTLYAHWSVNTYTITYNLDNGAWPDGSTALTSYTIESTGALPEPTRKGYDFAGWKVTSNDGNWTETGFIQAGTSVNGKYGNVTFTAQWNARSDTAYKVEYYKKNAAGDEYSIDDTLTINATNGTSGASLNLSNLKKEITGFEYYGASTTGDSTQSWTILGDGSLVIKLYYIPTIYTITYELNDTTPEDTADAVLNGEVVRYNIYGQGSTEASGTLSAETNANLVAPTRAGYTFAGWKATTVEGNWVENNTYSAGTSLIDMYGNVTLTAVWEAKELTVTLDANGGTVDPASIQVTYFEEYGEIPTPTRLGYTFDGWRAGILVHENQFEMSAGYSDNWGFGYAEDEKTYTAVVYLILDAEDFSGEITFQGRGLEVGRNELVFYNESFSDLMISNYSDSDCQISYQIWEGTVVGGDVDSNTTVTITDDHTLYAQWTANTYTITYDANKPTTASKEISGTVANATHTYDVSKALSSSYYKLEGWT